MITYQPEIIDYPKVVDVHSCWGNIPTILKDIIQRFNIKTDLALEFGVEHGYSTSALANYFKQVIGVDTFKQDFVDINSNRPCEFEKIKEILKGYSNIQLIESRFEEFIKHNENRYDLIHIDIIHDYEPTYEAGTWAVQHSDCVIFHDILSFPGVMRACEELATKYNFEFYNYEEDFTSYPVKCGLGILIKKI